MSWTKIFDIVDWLTRKLPISDRLESVRNNIDKLEREENEILKEAATPSRVARLANIRSKLSILYKRMQNASGKS